MTIMSDRCIRETAAKHAMIEPFVKSRRRDGAVSFCAFSHCVDARVTNGSRYRAVTD